MGLLVHTLHTVRGHTILDIPGELLLVSLLILLGVGDVKTSINSALQSSKHLCSGGSPGESYIETSSESSGSIVIVFDTIHVSVNVGVSLVNRVQVELLQDPSGEEQSSAVAGSVVGKTHLDPVPGQLVAVRGADDNVPLQPGVGNLAANISVGEAHDHPVLGCVVLVLVLNHE